MIDNDYKHRAQRDIFYDLINQAAKSLSMAQKLAIVMTKHDSDVKHHGHVIGDIKTVLYDLHSKWAYEKKEKDNKNNWLLDFLDKKSEVPGNADTPDF